MDGCSPPLLLRDTGQLFKHAQLESVKAWISDPAHGALPLHARIQRGIRQLILDGALDVGRPLPASRALAKSLEVSRDTIESAYTQLHAEGFIERRVGSGSFVSERAQRLPGRGKARPKGDNTGTPRLSQRGAAMFKSGGVRDFLTPRPFAPGVPETRSFPLPTWERLERQVLKEYGTSALLHSPPQGMEPLRRAIADYVNLERGARARPERVLVLADIFEALTAADRPYKKAKPLSVAIDILAKMVADQHVDEDVFKLFLTSGIYLKYAKRYLNPEQIDDVDIAKYL